MSYSDFQLPDVIEKFGLVTREVPRLFSDRPPVQPSAQLVEILKFYSSLGITIRTEKARSEFIVAPILAEVKALRAGAVSLFSGMNLTVEPSQGLAGTCDFLFSLAPEQLFVKAPIVTLVEAKREDLSTGWGQCAAEMVGAQLFNERAGNPIKTIYGAVTMGSLWQFFALSEKTLTIDVHEYGIDRIDRILGILTWMTSPQN